MARYYVDIVHEAGCICDEEGMDLLNKDAMRQAASRVILDMARDEIDEE